MVTSPAGPLRCDAMVYGGHEARAVVVVPAAARNAIPADHDGAPFFAAYGAVCLTSVMTKPLRGRAGMRRREMSTRCWGTS